MKVTGTGGAHAGVQISNKEVTMPIKSPSNPNLLYMVVIIVSSSSTLYRAIEIKIKRVCTGLLFPGDLDPSSLTLGGSVVLLVCGFMRRDNSWRGASCLRKSRLD